MFALAPAGPINWWCREKGCADSYPFIVNDNGASFTGSHIMHVDYDREMLSQFMDHDGSAEGMVKGAGNIVANAYNLKGDLVKARSDGGCSGAPHFSNTDPSGCASWEEVMHPDVTRPDQADWVMQSLCSAHLEERHQWGAGLGVEDDLFITNEEWTSFLTGADYTGIPGHVVDLKSMDMQVASLMRHHAAPPRVYNVIPLASHCPLSRFRPHNCATSRANKHHHAITRHKMCTS